MISILSQNESDGRRTSCYLRVQDGGTAAEYALILALVGAGIAAAALFLGATVASSMNNTSILIASASGGSTTTMPPSQGPADPPNSHRNNPNAGAGNNNGNGNQDPGGNKN